MWAFFLEVILISIFINLLLNCSNNKNDNSKKNPLTESNKNCIEKQYKVKKTKGSKFSFNKRSNNPLMNGTSPKNSNKKLDINSKKSKAKSVVKGKTNLLGNFMKKKTLSIDGTQDDFILKQEKNESKISKVSKVSSACQANLSNKDKPIVKSEGSIVINGSGYSSKKDNKSPTGSKR
ncbi:Hypothetical protein SRAE_1000051000 [Strongyloides ratti]|uniref:Uncharacterized protein n=1 Tax=Strongyloides ratti TaxID=34506 RepID=A0A090L2D3_STRRB|nr:Hypothetical protein SRAE_1000051000 [Strongyloides ratti]CEF62237.1 Hypothetical protein SRAE_1000051000 [Strongyloides ratti]